MQSGYWNTGQDGETFQSLTILIIKQYSTKK